MPEDIDKIRLRKFGCVKTYYFAGLGNLSYQIRKETYDDITAYQARTLSHPESGQFILTMLENDNKKLRIGKN